MIVEDDDFDSEDETVFAAEDFLNVPNHVLLHDCVVENKGLSWDRSEFDINFIAGYNEHGIGVTARKSAYLGLAWITLAAMFRNERFICDIVHNKSILKTMIIGPIEPDFRNVDSRVKTLKYEAEHPFRTDHAPNKRMNRWDYPMITLGRFGDTIEMRKAFVDLQQELIFKQKLEIELLRASNAMMGFGTLAGHIFMAEFFLDMSRPSFSHPPHQSYAFEGEMGWTRTAPSSHLVHFHHTNLTGHFPEDYDEEGKMDGFFRNWNH